MKHKNAWCGFFSVSGAIAVGGVATTAFLAETRCEGSSSLLSSLMQKFINTSIGVVGNVEMLIHIGKSALEFPVIAREMAGNFRLNISKSALTEIASGPSSAMDSACQTGMWIVGLLFTLQLLNLAAQVPRLVIDYKQSQKTDENEANHYTKLNQRM